MQHAARYKPLRKTKPYQPLENLMKTLLTFALALTLSAPALAASKNAVERKVNIIAKIAHGVETHKVKAESGEEMVLKLYMKQSGEDRKEALKGFIRNANPAKLAFSDETTWGTLNTSGALTVYGWLDSDVNDDSEERKRNSDRQLKLADDIIRELGKMDGVSFGYTSGSSSYCGISFMGLLVVDEENGLIYEIALTSGGSC